MRNLMQYPITHEEVIQVLERKVQEERDKQMIGSIDGLVLNTVLEFVKTNPEAVMKQFGEFGKSD